MKPAKPVDRDVSELLRFFRNDVLEHSAIHDRLIADARNWNKLCSAMDIIEDTELAIDAYLSSPPGDDRGRLYLALYGMLQALYVQQNAVKHAAEAVGLPYELPLPFKKIRDLRHLAIGHPSNTGGKSYGIVQIHMTHETFDLYEFGDFKPTRIVARELIDKQNAEVLKLIKSIIEHVRAKYPEVNQRDPNAVYLIGPKHFTIETQTPDGRRVDKI